MPTARMRSAAVHIPGCGDLVLGGTGMTGDLTTAELMESIHTSATRVHTWRQINPMTKNKHCPSAVYFNGAVYVAGGINGSVEMLSLPHNQPGQWTLILEKDPQSGCIPWSMCVYNGRFLVSCEFKDIHLAYLSGHFSRHFIYQIIH